MARETGGGTITKWQWAFVHFGPFCRESLQEINRCVSLGLIESESKQSDFDDTDFTLYWCSDENDLAIEGQLPIYVSSSLRSSIKKWSDDTSGLLDYVYFETEPMINAIKGDILDFSLAVKLKIDDPIKMLKLTKKQILNGKEALARLSQKMKINIDIIQNSTLITDINFELWLKSLDIEDLPTGLVGKAKLNLP